MGGCRNTGSLSWVERKKTMGKFEKEYNVLLRRLTAVLLVFAMLVTMLPASISYADADYGFQPEDADDASKDVYKRQTFIRSV